MSSESPFPNLAGHQFMSLTTFRRNGIAVPTPVWFAEHDGRLYVTTQAQAGKAKRVRATGRVTVAPCTARGELLGETAEGQARLLPESDAARAYQILLDKYGQQFTDVVSRNPNAHRVFIEIAPAS
ncbi:MAG: PPOX class F420-dependent oxidoreductase [Anaerolineae bacterium]|nr:PPOX class F420-dependent oxidoreductase [Anaerolineae bacterium]